ncbi:MAG: hypothetical protein R3312_00840 [Gammaproteobacteria bacterium]|nr:hypothetical protein [Gammaproteobacteria bacterium]
MLQILRFFLEIALMMRPPQELPASRSLMYLAVITYSLVSLLLIWPKLGALVGLLLVIAEVMVISIFIQLILYVKKHPGRFVQALTAVMGAGVVISVLMLPLVYGVYTAGGVEQVSSMVLLVIYILFAWSLTVNAFIFRYAFDLPNLFIGIVYSLGLYILSEVIMAILFGSKLVAS